MPEGGQRRTPVAPAAERTQIHIIEWVRTTFSSLVGSLQSLHPGLPPGSAQLVLLYLPYPLSFRPGTSFTCGLCAPCKDQMLPNEQRQPERCWWPQPESPSVEVFKKHIDVALWDMV